MDEFWQRDSLCLRRDGLILFQRILEEDKAPTWPIIRRPSRFITLRTLAMLLPSQIVDIVEGNVGWPHIFNNIQEEDRNVQNLMHPREFLRLAGAVRDINQSTWTPDVSYLLRNLQAYTTFNLTLLSELEFFGGMRSSATTVEPALDMDDFSGLESALELLATDLVRMDYLTIHLDHDRHIPTLRQLNRFLNH